MDLFQAIVLGLIQGITEWLPISSKAQLFVVAWKVFGIAPESAFRYAVFLHIGTLLAAAIFFRKELVKIIKLEDMPMLKFIVTALVGTAITAAPLYFLFKGILANATILLMPLIGIALLFTGAIQLRKKIAKPREDIGHGFITGLAQGLSAIPGISRSGIATTALLLQDFNPEQAFRIAFILSVPSVLLGEIGFAALEGIAFEPNALIAVAIAAIVGYASIGMLLIVARRVRFSLFCIAFGLLYLAVALL